MHTQQCYRFQTWATDPRHRGQTNVTNEQIRGFLDEGMQFVLTELPKWKISTFNTREQTTILNALGHRVLFLTGANPGRTCFLCQELLPTGYDDLYAQFCDHTVHMACLIDPLYFSDMLYTWNLITPVPNCPLCHSPLSEKETRNNRKRKHVEAEIEKDKQLEEVEKDKEPGHHHHNNNKYIKVLPISTEKKDKKQFQEFSVMKNGFLKKGGDPLLMLDTEEKDQLKELYASQVTFEDLFLIKNHSDMKAIVDYHITRQVMNLRPYIMELPDELHDLINTFQEPEIILQDLVFFLFPFSFFCFLFLFPFIYFFVTNVSFSFC
jgi:hypothetical protein